MVADQPIRILIADDHTFYREGVRAMLSIAPQFRVVGEASTGDEALRLAASLRPDLVLMDINMPGLNGIAATRAILADQPTAAILIVTMYDDDDSVFAAMRAGARGYLLKDARHDELFRAISAVSSGEAIFSPAIARRMIHYFGQHTPPAPARHFPELTEREREVLALVALGRSNETIANQLHLSLKTVRNHVSNILTKLQVRDRAQAIVKARDAGV
ncbi:MAG: response regulator [Oscillochloridaceae bacterium umkhey_bin13]